MNFLKSLSVVLLVTLSTITSQVYAKIELNKLNVGAAITCAIVSGIIGHELSKPEPVEKDIYTKVRDPKTGKMVKHKIRTIVVCEPTGWKAYVTTFTSAVFGGVAGFFVGDKISKGIKKFKKMNFTNSDQDVFSENKKDGDEEKKTLVIPNNNENNNGETNVQTLFEEKNNVDEKKEK